MNVSTARVSINGIDVGALPADQYEQLVKEVRLKKVLYLRQAENFLWVMVRFCFTWFAVAVILSIVVLLIALLYDASLLPAFIDSVRTSPVEGTQWIRSVAGFHLFVSFLMLVPAQALLRVNTGYVNHFDRVIAAQLRHLMEVPAEGQVDVLIKRGQNNSAGNTTIHHGSSEQEGK
jgi:hypothetical protein